MTGRKYDPACAAKSTLPGCQYSAYRDDAERYRRKKADPPTHGMSQTEWEELCESMAQYWEAFADRHEQAIREGNGYDFPYGQPSKKDT